MKIILAAKSVHPFHPFGGVQKYVYNYARSLRDAGAEVEVIAPLDGGKPRQEDCEGVKYTLLNPAIYKYLEYPAGWLGVHIFSSNLARYLKRQDFDLLHSFDAVGYQYLKLGQRRPVISHIFTDNYLCNPISLWNAGSLFGLGTEKIKEAKVLLSPFSGKRAVFKYLLQYLFKVRPVYQCLARSEGVFFEGEGFLEEVCLAFRINRDKCGVLPVGVDISSFSEGRENAVSRHELGIGEHDLVMITVNRLAADKGVDKIVLALDEARRDIPGIKLIIIGSGYQEKEISELILKKRLGPYVRHFKNVPERGLPAFYKAADIYISAFSYPGSSVSTLEAMACGLPVITTAQPWLVKDGKCGIAINDNNPGSIKDAILRLAGNRPDEMAGACRVEAEKYDWRNIAKTALIKYNEILKRR